MIRAFNERMEELQRLRSLDPDGLLVPEKVVEAAKSKDSPLHGEFTWDNKKAAHEHRLQQARALIRIFLVVHPETREVIKANISLGSDRKRKGGGYRTGASVLDDPERRAEYAAMALGELASWRQRYAALKPELGSVLAAIDRVLSQREKTQVA